MSVESIALLIQYGQLLSNNDANEHGAHVVEQLTRFFVLLLGRVQCFVLSPVVQNSYQKCIQLDMPLLQHAWVFLFLLQGQSFVEIVGF